MEHTELIYRRLPEAELEIMQIVWDACAPVTSADVLERVTPRGKWAKTTVLNFLSRLEGKGFISTSKQGKCNVYVSQVDESGYIAQETTSMLGKLHKGSLTGLVSSLYECGTIDDDDLIDLADYISRQTQPEEDSADQQEGRWKSWYKRYFHTRGL